MEFKWLEDFLSLAETGNFSKSAEQRNVTQPAFSRRIKSLEHWLGADLIDRTTFPTALTLHGRSFRETSEEVLRLLRNARDEIREEEHRSQVVLSFAALHTLSISFYPKWFSVLAKEFPNLTSKVRALDLRDCMEALTEGSCDFFLGYGHDEVPVLLDPGEYPHLVLSSEGFRPVSAPDENGKPIHSWPGKPNRPTQLLSFAPNCFFGKVEENMMNNLGPARHQDIVYENSMSEALRAMALAGQGMAWLPQSLIQEDLDRGLLVPAAEDKWHTVLEIRLYRYSKRNRPIVEKVWKSTQKHCQTLA